MKTVIQKRADQLQPGDIIRKRNGNREVVQNTHEAQFGISVQTAVISLDGRLSAKCWARHITFDVEVDQLSPAQRHADELVELLLAAANILRGGNLSAQEHERKIRTLLAKLEPIEPPTLQEALGALMKLADGAGAVMAGTWEKDSMQPERTAAHDIIRRARAAGVLK